MVWFVGSGETLNSVGALFSAPYLGDPKAFRCWGKTNLTYLEGSLILRNTHVLGGPVGILAAVFRP